LKPNTGNRFDSPTGSFGVRYFATSLDGCYGETLARFRPDLELAAVVGDEWREMGVMDIGDIPADWRQQRSAVHVRLPPGGDNAKFSRGVQFLDVESLETREALREHLAPLLALWGYHDFDISDVRGRDRRITRYIGQWAYEQFDADERPLYAGVRYLSRLNSDWECWAIFDNVEIEELARRPILPQDDALQRIARSYGLKVY
jgi:hypothetical protein